MVFGEYIKNKTVALVGPAAYMVGTGYGVEIDQHDIIVRLNRGAELIEKYSDDIGARTDILYSCLIEKPGNAGPYQPQVLKDKYGIKMVVAPPHSDYRGIAYATKLHELVNRIKAQELSQTLTLRIVDHKFHTAMAKSIECKPNTSFMAIYDILRYEPSRLSLYGFSFYLDGFMPGCKRGVEDEQVFADNCFVSKRHVQKNMWKAAKNSLLGLENVATDRVLTGILNMQDFSITNYQNLKI